MTGLELRPLSLGEILDRTFSIYRRHFVLFAGISLAPRIVLIALTQVQVWIYPQSTVPGTAPFVVFSLGILLATLAAYLFSQGGTTLAIAEIYLGRPATISGSLRAAGGHLGFLFGAIVLNGLVVGLGFVLLVVPGIFLLCRLFVCIPVVLIEERSPSESLSRSFHLSKGFFWRILAMYFFVALTMIVLISIPYGILANVFKDPAYVLALTSIYQLAVQILSSVLQPILLIAVTIYYFDLRVRKEAFDLQFMLDPHSAGTSRGSNVPSILS